jgi:hypothetical protein
MYSINSNRSRAASPRGFRHHACDRARLGGLPGGSAALRLCREYCRRKASRSSPSAPGLQLDIDANPAGDALALESSFTLSSTAPAIDPLVLVQFAMVKPFTTAAKP